MIEVGLEQLKLLRGCAEGCYSNSICHTVWDSILLSKLSTPLFPSLDSKRRADLTYPGIINFANVVANF